MLVIKMPQTDVVTVNCLACNKNGGNTKMFQCSACTKPIHAHCLLGKNEIEMGAENALTNLFKSIKTCHFICSICEQEVNSFFVKMSNKKVTAIVDGELEVTEGTESASEKTPNQVEDNLQNETITDKEETIENRKMQNNTDYKDRHTCKFFNTGNCNFNNACKNTHPDTKNFCRDYMNGRCSFKNCKYAHPDLCWAAQRNRCFRKSCNYFHAPPPTEYRNESSYPKRYVENKRCPLQQNENKPHFLENIMRGFQQQLEQMQKMIISQNQRGPPTYPQGFPPFPPTMPCPPPPPQPQLGRHF